MENQIIDEDNNNIVDDINKHVAPQNLHIDPQNLPLDPQNLHIDPQNLPSNRVQHQQPDENFELFKTDSMKELPQNVLKEDPQNQSTISQLAEVCHPTESVEPTQVIASLEAVSLHGKSSRGKQNEELQLENERLKHELKLMLDTKCDLQAMLHQSNMYNTQLKMNEKEMGMQMKHLKVKNEYLKNIIHHYFTDIPDKDKHQLLHVMATVLGL